MRKKSSQSGKKRKLGEGGVNSLGNGEAEAALTTSAATAMTNGHMSDAATPNSEAALTAGGAGAQVPSIEDVVLRPPAPDELIATYVLVSFVMSTSAQHRRSGRSKV